LPRTEVTAALAIHIHIINRGTNITVKSLSTKQQLAALSRLSSLTDTILTKLKMENQNEVAAFTGIMKICMGTRNTCMILYIIFSILKAIPF